MRRAIFCAATGVLLAACAPPVPDSSPTGPAFSTYGDSSTYRAGREGTLTGATTVVPPSAAGTAGDPSLPNADGTPTTGAGETQIATNNPTISDEQDFDAVASRETIESDAERLRAQREAFTQVQPTAVPSRASSGPNVVAYALSTQHPVGTKVHSRSPFSGQSRYDRNCGRYASADLAQEAFLKEGGPERDRLGLDPDGDGYACSWNPAPFRRVAASR